MNVESGLHFENFARQSGLSCSFTIPESLDRQSSIILGVSGDSLLKFSIRNGIVYDSNDRNIFSINSSQNVDLTIKAFGGTAGFFCDGILLSHESFSGYFTDVLLSGDRDFETTYSVTGTAPKLSFTGTNNFSSGVGDISGYVISSNPLIHYKIKSIDLLNNYDKIEVKEYESGNISQSGLVVFSSISGSDFPSGSIDFAMSTNCGIYNLSFISDPVFPFTFEEYLEVYSNPSELSTLENKTYTINSYFNSGNSRQIRASLENVSLSSFTPVLTSFYYNGSGFMSGFVSGVDYISGLLTGQFSGSTGITFESGLYYFTGVQTGNFSTTASGIPTSGIFSGQVVTGNLSFNYSQTLTSGDSGIITGIRTGYVSGDYYSLSGYKTVNYSFSSDYTTDSTNNVGGFSGSGFNFQNGLRSRIPSGFIFSMLISGIDTGVLALDDQYVRFEIADWLYEPILGSGKIVGYSRAINKTFLINPSNISGYSGDDVIYTGIIPYGSYDYSYNPNTTILDDLIGENVSGYIEMFIGAVNGYEPSTSWQVSQFNILNMPVDYYDQVVFTGSGYYSGAITGYVNKFINQSIETGIMYSSGQPNFTDVWNFKLGNSYDSFSDFKYWNFVSGDKYINNNFYLESKKNSVNSFFMEIDHNGQNLSGVNIAKLAVSDGSLSLEYLITGEGE